MSEEVSAPARLLFNRWDTSEVTIRDPGIARYVNLNSMMVPHSCGRLTRQEFHKCTVREPELDDGAPFLWASYPPGVS